MRAHSERIRSELESAFAEEHTPHEVATSFSVGTFITALPTLGTGLVLFVIIAYVFERASKLALFASVLVLNPAAKWGVYAASYWLGVLLLGPPSTEGITDVSLSAGPDVLARLVLGNVILAVAFAVVGYFFALHLIHGVRNRNVSVGEFVPEEGAE